MKKALLIVNPCAGQKKARRFLMDMVDILNRGDFQVLVHVTAAPGDGEAAVLRYAGRWSGFSAAAETAPFTRWCRES